jgi:proteasome beta subunit
VYRGSSFSELVKVDHPQLDIDWSSWIQGQGDRLSVPHGTTVLAFKYEDGVLVAGDRLATEGLRVASRDVQKVYATDAHSMIAIAGAAGPAIEMARIMRIELEHYEKIEGEALELDGKANKLSQMVRANLPAAMQGLPDGPRQSAGCHAGSRRGAPLRRLRSAPQAGADVEVRRDGRALRGGRLRGDSRATKHEAIEIAVQALTDAADEDRGTGGIDTLRGIFPTMIFCSEQGIEQGAEDEIRVAYETIIGRRGAGGAA